MQKKGCYGLKNTEPCPNIRVINIAFVVGAV